jgi:HSP20 family protein
MQLVRWSPFRLNHSFDRLFGPDLFDGVEGKEFRSWSPAVDIFERGDDLVLRAEVPDVKKEDLELKVENDVLTLGGERKCDESVERDSYHRIERHYGSFRRSFTLPSSVDSARIKATCQDGVLEVVLPKAEAAKPRQIPVQVS